MRTACLSTPRSPSVKLWLAQNWIMRMEYCMVYRTTISGGYNVHRTLWLASFFVLLTVRYFASARPVTFASYWSQPIYLAKVIKRHVSGRVLWSAVDTERPIISVTKKMWLASWVSMLQHQLFGTLYHSRLELCYYFHIPPPVKNIILSSSF